MALNDTQKAYIGHSMALNGKHLCTCALHEGGVKSDTATRASCPSSNSSRSMQLVRAASTYTRAPSSEVIKSHQRSSVTIRSHQGSSEDAPATILELLLDAPILLEGEHLDEHTLGKGPSTG